jgi:hypothetical protein
LLRLCILGVSMATRMIATIGASSTFTHTMQNDAKVMVCVTGTTAGHGITLNGAHIFFQVGSTSAGRATYSTYLYAAAGQTLTFATGTDVSAVISLYEG